MLARAEQQLLGWQEGKEVTVPEAVLSHCVDYAGLFPPAGLDLRTAVENYQRYREGPDAWALNRLVLPAAKASEFAAGWPELAAKAPLSVLLGSDVEEDARSLFALGLRIDCLEARFTSPSKAARVQQFLPVDAEVYWEVATTCALEEAVRAIGSAGARAKIRMGGTTPDAIPQPQDVVRFVSCCIRHQVPFKATAGLHHALRGPYPLTYEENAPLARMHGFINLLLAAAVLYYGGGEADACEVLEGDSPASFAFALDKVRWHHRAFSAEQIAEVRRNALISFGSCSFTEPVEGLKELVRSA